MKIILRQEILFGALQRVKSWAQKGFFDGQNTGQYFKECNWYIQQYECQIIFTRDIGHHTCGWWKNPQYERCYHLSISFSGGKNKNGLAKIIDGLFGENKKMIWMEPPYSEQGKNIGCWHYRLFCDENWQPIIPKGEVYSTEFTEKGWKSYSEVKSNKKQ